MAEPLSWVALEYIKTLLEKIKIADGFHTDSGDNVELEPYQLGSEDSTKTLRVVEDDSEITGQTNEAHDSAVNVVIESYHSVDESNSQLTAHRVRADILKAIPTRTRGFPLGVYSIKVNGKKVLQRPEGYPFTVVQIRLQIRLTEPAAAS